jgi:hypothetical protein
MSTKSTATAYPLAWPDGWPRTPPHQRHSGSPFGSHLRPLSFDGARRDLMDELGRLRVKDIVLSTNVQLRGDGAPMASAAGKRMTDPGVAIYFTMKGRPLAMARDIYMDVAANMRSLFLAIDGLRKLERHGGGYMMDRAFSGFVALPPPPTCWQVLEIPPTSDKAAILAAFKTMAMQTGHGGILDMDYLVKARDAALKEINQ